MADQTIGTLPQAASVADDARLVAEIQGQAVQITGGQLKELVAKGVEVYVKDAQDAAVAAQDAAKQAGDSLAQIGDSVTQAGNAAAAAQSAQNAAENAKTAAESAAGSAAEAVEEHLSGYVTSAEQAKTAAEAANSNAQQAKTDAQAARTAAQSAQAAAEGAKTDAQNAAAQAAKDKTDAQTAKTAALAAQEAAQTAQAAAEAYNTVAAGNAAEAAASAATAQDSARDAEASRQAIENMGAAGETLSPTQPVRVTKSVSPTGVVTLTFGIPQGVQGRKGDTGDDGTGIDRVEQTSGTGAPGTWDTYTIYLTNGTGYTFRVYNGMDGTGSGDFMASGSVPMTGSIQMDGNKITNVGAPTADTDAARLQEVKAKQDKITGTKGQIVGFDDDGNAVAQEAPETGVSAFNGRTGAVSPQSGDYTATMVGARSSTWIPSASDVGAIPAAQKGAASGVAELDASGKVPTSQLPAYVDDVLEYPSRSSFPATGEDGKIYVAEDTNLTYRWGGSSYVEISPSLALGETASTAYRGDRGKTAYDHSQTTGNPHGTTADDVGALSDTTTLADLEGDATHRLVTDTEKSTWNEKQAKLTGTAGQIVGFDSSGNAVAQEAPETGVTSFKGRTGAVTPASGDYTAAQVGAMPAVSGGTAGQILTKTSDGQAWQDAPDSAVVKLVRW